MDRNTNEVSNSTNSRVAILTKTNSNISYDHNGKICYDCIGCNTKFTKKQDLKKHMLLYHEGKKPFECKVCNKIFLKVQSVRSHIASIHDRTRLFECIICLAKFAEKQNLNTHIASIHEGKKPFQCTRGTFTFYVDKIFGFFNPSLPLRRQFIQ